ncbi:MAG: hypothetical protein ACYC7E_01600 [Armatimonadota bacterium]
MILSYRKAARGATITTIVPGRSDAPREWPLTVSGGMRPPSVSFCVKRIAVPFAVQTRGEVTPVKGIWGSTVK